MIADSAMPKEVHERLMKDLRRVLTEEQIEQILDKYTVGKVAFTLKGYQAIVPKKYDGRGNGFRSGTVEIGS